MDVTDQNKTEETFNKILKEFGDLDFVYLAQVLMKENQKKG